MNEELYIDGKKVEPIDELSATAITRGDVSWKEIKKEIVGLGLELKIYEN